MSKKRVFDEMTKTHTNPTSTLSSPSSSSSNESMPSEPVGIAFAGHRGFGANQVQRQRSPNEAFPENSLISLQKVMESGADFIEFDLYLSRDEHLMVIHDDDLSINTHYILQEDDKNKMSDGKGGFLPVGSKVSLKKGSALVSGWDADELRKRFNISGEIAPPHNVNHNLYTKIPEFHEVLELVSAENARRAGLGLPRVRLNVELKGVGTGTFVQKAIEDFNASKGMADRIQQNEIFYISFLDRELATITGLIGGSKGAAVPDANVILGVPTSVQYSKVGDAYAIEDPTLNLPKLKAQVENLHTALQKQHGRGGKGLTGVDVSLWDVGDDSIKYFCGRLGVPIHLAVVPFGHKDFVREEVSAALINIRKIAAAQGKYFGGRETMIIKTDNPALLREILETQSKSIVSEISNVEIMKSGKTSSSITRDMTGITLFPKPGTGAHGKFVPVDNSWWGDQQLIPALRAAARHDHIYDPVVNEHGLRLALQDAAVRSENSFIIPMNVNVIDGRFVAGDANHWVGLRLTRNESDGKFNVAYVNPMGRAINGHTRDLLTEVFGSKLASITEPLTGKAIQATQTIEHGDADTRVVEFIGNTNDCGPILVYAMDCLSNSRGLPDRPLTGLESRILGQEIRGHFRAAIHEAAVARAQAVVAAIEIGSSIHGSIASSSSTESRAATKAHDQNTHYK